MLLQMYVCVNIINHIVLKKNNKFDKFDIISPRNRQDSLFLEWPPLRHLDRPQVIRGRSPPG